MVYLNKKLSNQIVWFNRLALFVVFFWFGFLKIFGVSPAKDLVSHLHRVTISNLISAEPFFIFLGILECVIGLIWLFPQLTKMAFFLFLCQMFTTFLPLIFLTSETWQENYGLTLAGQYIIKNVVLVASAYTVYAIENNKKN
jgi:uncharacterized membrane protein YkgB